MDLPICGGGGRGMGMPGGIRGGTFVGGRVESGAPDLGGPIDGGGGGREPGIPITQQTTTCTENEITIKLQPLFTKCSPFSTGRCVHHWMLL